MTYDIVWAFAIGFGTGYIAAAVIDYLIERRRKP